MGSQAGYRYNHKFFMVHEDEIKSFYNKTIKPGEKGLLFEFRTNFIVQKRTEKEEEEEVGILINSEKFAVCIYSQEDKSMEWGLLYSLASDRLEEYWMTPSETKLLLDDALTFANLKANEPENASLSVIPVVARLHVCTVQQKGESFADAMDRAIRAEDLLPLYLWREPTGFLRKPIGFWVYKFLLFLERVRVWNADQALAIMPVCEICGRRPTVGALISTLQCKHAFHAHCAVRWLEGSNLCPSCDVPAYCRSIVDRPPILLPRR